MIVAFSASLLHENASLGRGGPERIASIIFACILLLISTHPLPITLYLCVCVCVCVHVHICLFIKGKNGKVFYYDLAFLGFFLWFHLLGVEKWRNFIIKAIGAILRERVKKDEHHQECKSQRPRGNSEDHLRDQRLGSSLMGAEAKGIHCTSNVIQSPCLRLSTSTSSCLNVTFSSVKIQSLYSASKMHPTHFNPESFLWQICPFWTRNRSFLHFISQP